MAITPTSGLSPLRRRALAALLALSACAGAVVWHTAAQAAGGTAGAPSELVTIAPCRLVDTRAGADNVGTRSTKLGSDESASFTVFGSNGRCAIPASATGIVGNITAVNPTAASFLTVYPGDVDRPLAANVNVTAGSSPTPNQITVGLSAIGDLRVYNLAGTVDVVIDISGYYQLATTSGGGATGPQGAVGPTGPQGQPGATGAVGISGYEVVLVSGIMEIGEREKFVEVKCPAGKRVLGGGVATFNSDIKIMSSSPLDDGVRWFVQSKTYSGNAVTARSAVNVRVACAIVAM